MARPNDLLGNRIGPYRVVRLIGQGGFAKVYLAVHDGLGRQVALKVLLPSDANTPEVVARFVGDAHIAARLEHPSIVRIYDVGQQGGYYYIAMAYLDGGSLQTLLRRRRRADVRTALNIVRRIGSALDHAHSQGVVHRDVKPSNILLDMAGQSYLSDFGIARATWNPHLPGNKERMGTPEYMSPEQVQGKEVDARSDLYSLGIVLYEMICGRLPYQGESPLSVLHQIVYETPPQPQSIQRGVSPALQTVILRAIAKEPSRRYRSGAEMAQALTSAIGTRGVQRTGQSSRWDARRLGMVIGGLAVIGAVTAGGVWVAQNSRETTPTPTLTPTLIPPIKVTIAPTPTPTSSRTRTSLLPSSTPAPTRPSATPFSRADAEREIRALLEEFDQVKQFSRRWLDEGKLTNVLTGTALEDARASIKELREKGAYWEITLESSLVEDIHVVSSTSASARVKKVETRIYYEGGSSVPESSEAHDVYWVTYALLPTGGGWRVDRFEIETPTPTQGPSATRTTTRSLYRSRPRLQGFDSCYRDLE